MSSSRAIIRISATSKHTLRVNYSRRMYAIIRRYTPEAVEGATNECFAELTGLRTFFKMTYNELAQSITNDLTKEIGTKFTVRVAKVKEYEEAFTNTKKQSRKLTKINVSTYKEMNNLFAYRFLGKDRSTIMSPTTGVYGSTANKEKTFTQSSIVTKKIRLSIPFLGKVK